MAQKFEDLLVEGARFDLDEAVFVGGVLLLQLESAETLLDDCARGGGGLGLFGAHCASVCKLLGW